MSESDVLILLQEKVNDLDNKIATHISEEADRWKKMFDVQQENSQNIKDLTESTRELIDAWKIADGTVKAMSALGKFVKWLSGFAIIGVFITWLLDKYSG